MLQLGRSLVRGHFRGVGGRRPLFVSQQQSRVVQCRHPTESGGGRTVCEAVPACFDLLQLSTDPVRLIVGGALVVLTPAHSSRLSRAFCSSIHLFRKNGQPWLVWLSALSTGLRTETLPVRFLVRAHAWVAGQVPRWGHARGNQSVYLTHDLSLPLFLPPSPLSKNK